LGAIAEQHARRALPYLFDLQNTILDAGFIDIATDDLGFTVLDALPSYTLWKKHIRFID